MADVAPSTSSIDEGTYALLGAASFLGGAMRMTVCTCVMLLELTNNMALLPLIMLVLLVAKVRDSGTQAGRQAWRRSQHGKHHTVHAARTVQQRLLLLRATAHHGMAWHRAPCPQACDAMLQANTHWPC